MSDTPSTSVGSGLPGRAPRAAAALALASTVALLLAAPAANAAELPLSAAALDALASWVVSAWVEGSRNGWRAGVESEAGGGPPRRARARKGVVGTSTSPSRARAGLPGRPHDEDRPHVPLP